MMTEIPANTDSDKLARLRALIREMEGVLVAFSGGVDSTLLLKVACDELGDRVLAVTALSATTPAQERENAVSLAARIGAAHLTVETRELEDAAFAANTEEKCYLCKRLRFGQLLALARERGIAHVADGENADDHRDFRPGIRATRELGIRSPLREAGLTKAEIRALSRQLGLPTWNAPSAACLASRIPYHTPITPEKLRQVDAAEQYIRGLNLSAQVRVRHHGDVARLEVEPAYLTAFTDPSVAARIVAHFRSLGFRHVALDLEGYTMGSLNRALGLADEKER